MIRHDFKWIFCTSLKHLFGVIMLFDSDSLQGEINKIVKFQFGRSSQLCIHAI